MTLSGSSSPWATGRIALLGMTGIFPHACGRRDTGRRWLRKTSPIRPEWIQYDNYSFASGQRMCEALLNGGRRPTAVFAIADSIAIGAIRALSQRGILPGRDISVFGFDNTAISAAFVPSISTVAQPRFEIGAKAFDLLYEKMEESDLPGTAGAVGAHSGAAGVHLRIPPQP